VIEYAGAIFLVIGFVFILKATGLVEKSTRVIDISRQAMAVLRSAELDDDAKESAMQSYAKQLVGLFFLITIGGVAAVILPVMMIWGLDKLGLVSVDAVLDVALSWPFITASSVLIVLALVIKRKR
jgi:hypothetical protein